MSHLRIAVENATRKVVVRDSVFEGFHDRPPASNCPGPRLLADLRMPAAISLYRFVYGAVWSDAWLLVRASGYWS